MQRFTLLILLIMTTSALQAQRPEPVKWSFSTLPGEEGAYELVLTAEVEPGWYLYSQHLESDMGPIPTSFHFDEQEGLTLEGETAETGKKTEGYDPLFDMNIAKFAGEVRFTQNIRTDAQVEKVTGYLEFMTCNDEVCLPPREVEFSILLKGE